MKNTKVYCLYFPKIHQKKFFGRPAAGDLAKTTRNTLYDYLILGWFIGGAAAGRPKKFWKIQISERSSKILENPPWKIQISERSFKILENPPWKIQISEQSSKILKNPS
jgi:hypothetical protein